MHKLRGFIKNLFIWFRILTLGSFLTLLFFIVKNSFKAISRGDTSPVWDDIRERYMKFKFGGKTFWFKGKWMGYATEIYGRRVYFPSAGFEFKEGMTIVDLGASGGVFSIPAAMIGSRVISVEADKEVLGELRENGDRNGCSEKMRIVWGIIGSLASVIPKNMKTFKDSSPNELPPILDMNELVKDIKTIHFLKVDIEGSEFSLFSKNNSWLSKVQRIAMEIHGNDPEKYGELKDILERSGFAVRMADALGIIRDQIDGSEYYLFAEKHSDGEIIPDFFDALKITFAQVWLKFLNSVLAVFGRTLFFRKIGAPKNILIYKLGNIGDIVCAMPAMRAVRGRFPDSRITLLTSPGERGAVGAKDFLDGAPYLDEIKDYYSDDISTVAKIIQMIFALRAEKYDLFIQLPDDWARFGTLLRNEIFARSIGAVSAMGFYLRTSNIFKKAQVDFTYKEREVTSLLNILERNGINHSAVKFEFPEYGPLSADIRTKMEKLKRNNDIVLGVCMGGKTKDKKWPAERYGEALRKLGEKRKIGAVFFGGSSETESIERAAKASGLAYVSFAGLPIKESILAIKSMDAFLTNDTGPMHIAAAFGIPIVALFSTRSIFGSWFPYGENSICLHKKFFKCDYTNEECVKRSILAISVDDVVRACEKMFDRISKN